MDYEIRGFEWIDANNNDQSIFIFIRRGMKDEDTEYSFVTLHL